MNPFDKLRSVFFRQEAKPPKTEVVASDNRDIAKQFSLRLGSLNVGKLRYGNKLWSFEYTPEYQDLVHKEMAVQVIGFPNVEQLYTSETLWPFFLVRLPGKYIQTETNGVALPEVELLERYGRRTIANPYELALVN